MFHIEKVMPNIVFFTKFSADSALEISIFSQVQKIKFKCFK